jgi:hypothetical protein
MLPAAGPSIAIHQGLTACVEASQQQSPYAQHGRSVASSGGARPPLPSPQHSSATCQCPCGLAAKAPRARPRSSYKPLDTTMWAWLMQSRWQEVATVSERCAAFGVLHRCVKRLYLKIDTARQRCPRAGSAPRHKTTAVVTLNDVRTSEWPQAKLDEFNTAFDKSYKSATVAVARGHMQC